MDHTLYYYALSEYTHKIVNRDYHAFRLFYSKPILYTMMNDV